MTDVMFDEMYEKFVEWQKTHEAFTCVQASDFAEVWVTAYRAGMKAASSAEAVAVTASE